MSDFSNYIIYADESGDHSLTKVDLSYPIFVLCLCIFEKRHYINYVVPAVQKLKFDYFGHDCVIFHEREIRKKENDFAALSSPEVFNGFQLELSNILARSRMKIVSCVIDKNDLKGDLFAPNPYAIALRCCVEDAVEFISRKENDGKRLHFLFERRGAKEDNELELEFLRIASGINRFHTALPEVRIRMLDKKANAPGMQIADLTARPIGIKAIRPNQANRAFDIIKPKLARSMYKRSTRFIVSP